jgi:hypothetical protein
MEALPNGKAKLSLNEKGYKIEESKDLQSKESETSREGTDTIKGIDYSASKILIKDTEKLHLCKYISGTFTDTESRYHIQELETLACVKILEKWKIDLLPSRFLLRTDSKYLTGFWKYKIKADHKQGRLIRWQMKFQQFEPYIQYIKSEQNSFADTLTREWSKQ